MAQTNHSTSLWFTAGLLFSLFALLIVFSGLAGNVYVADSDGIPEAANAVLTSIQSGNWDELEAIVSGDHTLRPNIGEDDSASQIIYYAYQESLRWKMDTDFEIQENCITQDVTVSCLDVPRVTKAVIRTLDASTAIDFDQDRKELLRTVAEQVLLEFTPIKVQKITLVFQRNQGQWLLLPDAALLNLISGFSAV